MSVADVPASTAQDSEDDLLPSSRHDLFKFTEEKKPAKRPSLLGIGLLLLSGLLFSLATLFVKLLEDIPAIESAAARCLIQFGCVVPVVLCKVEGSPFGPRNQLPWLLARAVFGVTTAACAFYAVKHMPMGDATVLVFTSPIWTGIISRLLLKEPWGLWEAGASLLSITGIVFVAHPPFLFGMDASVVTVMQNSSLIQNEALSAPKHSATVAGAGGVRTTGAVTAALAASVSMALALVAGRKAGQKVHFLVITMYYGMVGFVITSFIAAATRQLAMPRGFRQCAYLVIVGVFGLTGQVALNRGLILERAVVGALVRNMDVVLAFVFQVIVFGEAITVWSTLGTLLILSATLSITWKRWREQVRTSKQ